MGGVIMPGDQEPAKVRTRRPGMDSADLPAGECLHSTGIHRKIFDNDAGQHLGDLLATKEGQEPSGALPEGSAGKRQAGYHRANGMGEDGLCPSQRPGTRGVSPVRRAHHPPVSPGIGWGHDLSGRDRPQYAEPFGP